MDIQRTSVTSSTKAEVFELIPQPENRIASRSPIGIPFIIISKLFERFAFLSIQTVLVIYLTSVLSFTNDGATVAYHGSMGLQFLASLIGAIISDNYLGKYKTIVLMSAVYLSGVLLLFFGSVLNLPSQTTLLALVMLSFGVGCLKPCMQSFGGDQFKLPEQAKQAASFFSLFYMTLKVGSLLSTIVAPILRNDVKCFGQDHCFPMVFGSSLVFAALAIGFFVAGSKWYRKSPNHPNILLKVCQCIIFSIRNKDQRPNTSHWLDKSIPKYGNQLVTDTKILLRILILFIPIPVYWSLAEQIGSRFTIQALNMNGLVPFYTIKPDQFQVLHPLLIIMLIPIFDVFIYPALKRVGVRQPLHIMTIGGLFAASSFLVTALLEMQLMRSYAVPAGPQECQLRLFNPLPCDFVVNTNIPGHEQFSLDSMDSVQRNVHQINGIHRVEFTSTNCTNKIANIELTNYQAISYLLLSNAIIRFEDNVKKSLTGKHLLRLLPAEFNQSISIVDTVSRSVAFDARPDVNTQIPLLPSDYQIASNGVPILHVSIMPGGVSTLLLGNNSNRDAVTESKLIEITPPNRVHMLWQLPQYICMAAGDIMFSITGLSFNYAEAPASLKTVMQATWLFSIAIGNGLDMTIVAAHMFKSQAFEFLAFAALLYADMAIFLWLARRYQRSKEECITEISATNQ